VTSSTAPSSATCAKTEVHGEKRAAWLVSGIEL